MNKTTSRQRIRSLSKSICRFFLRKTTFYRGQQGLLGGSYSARLSPLLGAPAHPNREPRSRLRPHLQWTTKQSHGIQPPQPTADQLLNKRGGKKEGSCSCGCQSPWYGAGIPTTTCVTTLTHTRAPTASQHEALNPPTAFSSLLLTLG